SSQHSGPASPPRDQDHGTRGTSQLHSLRRAYQPDKDRHRSISATPPQERSWFSRSDSRVPKLVEILLSPATRQVCALVKTKRRQYGNYLSTTVSDRCRTTTTHPAVDC